MTSQVSVDPLVPPKTTYYITKDVHDCPPLLPRWQVLKYPGREQKSLSQIPFKSVCLCNHILKITSHKNVMIRQDLSCHLPWELVFPNNCYILTQGEMNCSVLSDHFRSSVSKTVGFMSHSLHLFGREHRQAASSDSLWATARSEESFGLAPACDAARLGSHTHPVSVGSNTTTKIWTD